MWSEKCKKEKFPIVVALNELWLSFYCSKSLTPQQLFFTWGRYR